MFLTGARDAFCVLFPAPYPVFTRVLHVLHTAFAATWWFGVRWVDFGVILGGGFSVVLGWIYGFSGWIYCIFSAFLGWIYCILGWIYGIFRVDLLHF